MKKLAAIALLGASLLIGCSSLPIAQKLDIPKESLEDIIIVGLNSSDGEVYLGIQTPDHKFKEMGIYSAEMIEPGMLRLTYKGYKTPDGKIHESTSNYNQDIETLEPDKVASRN